MMKAILPLVLTSVLPNGLFDFLHQECKENEILAVSTARGVEVYYEGTPHRVDGDYNVHRILSERDGAMGHCHTLTVEQYAEFVGASPTGLPADVLENRVQRWHPSNGDINEMLIALRKLNKHVDFYLLDSRTGRMVKYGLTSKKEKKFLRAGEAEAEKMEDDLLEEYRRIECRGDNYSFTRPVGDEPSLEGLIKRTRGTSFFIEDLGFYGR